MKFFKFLIVISITLFFYSCTTEPNVNPSQTIIDSIVNAKLFEYQNKLAQKNDSILIALSIQRADSIKKKAGR